jgi:hypothetical protein
MSWICPTCGIEGGPHFCEGKVVPQLKKRIKELESGIIKCLEENLHLADGDNCTLRELKKLVPDWN